MPQAAQLVDSIITKLDSGQAVLTIEDIRLQGASNRLKGWQQVALWLLAYEPQRMIQFSLATNTIEDLETHFIEDSLLQLARYFNYTEDKANMEQLTDAFCAMTEQRPERQLTFQNEFIHLLMKYASNERKHRLFDTIRRCGVTVHPYTWLHFATHFANNDQFELGLDALLIAHEKGAPLRGRMGYGFRSNCTTILRRSSEQPDGLRVCLRVVSTLVDIGVKFNLPICNVIMLNAIEAGDLRTAFAVYHSLKERGLTPDEITFLVLLKGCRMNVDDVQLLDEIIRDAISNLNLWKSEKVATEILHCLALHHSKHNPTTALNTLAEAYAQLFDLAPLKKLELPISPTLQTRLSEEAPMPPTRHAITFMIGATIQHYLATAPSPTAHTKQILDLYIRWRAHVSNESGTADPLLASLATTDHVANTFLSAFTRHPKTLLLATRVVRDLARPLPHTAIVQQCKPTVQTWSIFLLGFTLHGQMKLAEQVQTYMRKQGIEPNHVTWNTLIRGYAQVQDAENTAATLREAERAGMVWDVWTHKGLRRLRDRRKLEEELRKLRVADQLDFTGELKEGIAHRLQAQGDGQMEGFGDSAGDIAEQESPAYLPFG
jgi:pentatricopeptide repeat protein